MADKKYYWLKLNRGFFKRHDIEIIEAVKPHGKEYVLFYLKLLLESIDHEGELRFSEDVPYDDEMLSIVTKTEIDIVKPAMQLFKKLGMVKVLEDETIFMTGTTKLIGSETSSAERQRRSRESKKCDNVTPMSQGVTNCHTEIDIEKEKEKNKELNKEKEGESTNGTNKDQRYSVYDEFTE